MAKSASQRRKAKRCQLFTKMAEQSPEQFARLLETNLSGWVAEARFRAKTFTRSDEGNRVLKAFELVDHVKALIGSSKAQRTVQVLRTLEHECSKAVAKASDSRGYSLDKSTLLVIAEKRLPSLSR